MNLILTIALATLAGQVGPTPVSCCEGESITVGGSSILELVDQDGNLTIHDVRAPSMASRWTLNTNGVPSRGYSGEARWFWFSTINNTSEHQFIVLEVGWPVMNEVDIHIVGRGSDEQEQVSHYSSGSGRLFKLRPLPT